MKSTSETVDEVISGAEYLEYSEFFPFYSYPGFLLYKSKAQPFFCLHAPCMWNTFPIIHSSKASGTTEGLKCMPHSGTALFGH